MSWRPLLISSAFRPREYAGSVGLSGESLTGNLPLADSLVWAFTPFFGLGANIGVGGVTRELWEEFRSSATEASEIGRELASLAFEIALSW